MDHWFPRLNSQRCQGCGHCVKRCPTGALALVRNRAVLVHPQACTYCAACEAICPQGGIELPYLICLEDMPSKTPGKISRR